MGLYRWWNEHSATSSCLLAVAEGTIAHGGTCCWSTSGKSTSALCMTVALLGSANQGKSVGEVDGAVRGSNGVGERAGQSWGRGKFDSSCWI